MKSGSILYLERTLVPRSPKQCVCTLSSCQPNLQVSECCLPPCFQSTLHDDTPEDMSDDVDQTSKYKEEIRELRKQVQQLQDAGNFRDDTGSY